MDAKLKQVLNLRPHFNIADSIPLNSITDDGIAEIATGLYSKTYKVQDINYSIAKNEEKAAITKKWANILKSIDPAYDFQIMIYPAYISRENFGTDPDFAITDETPPTFIMQSEDDGLIDSSVCYYIALKKAKVPVEMHLFSRGGHGYGLLRNGNPPEAWPDLAYNWLCTDIMKARSW